MRQFQHYIDGAFEDGQARFDSIDPATGTPWAEMPEAREADVNRAVEAAHRALTSGSWPALTATARGKLLYRLADLVAENAQKLAEIETQDTGKIIRETSAQIAYVADYYRYYAGLADKIEGAHLSIDKPDMDVWLRREPIGVVAAIVPWNSQLFLAAVKIGPALAAGCTLVVKASEDGPAPLLEFARLVHEAGFPAGVVNIITGFGATCGAALTRHPKVAHVAFTGGPATARQVVRNSAENLASTSLELGGKSPFIVFADADLERAADAAVFMIYSLNGERCTSSSRLLVEESIYDRFTAMVAEKAKRIKVGHPLDPQTVIGPLIHPVHEKKVLEYIEIGKAGGATVAAGGTRFDGPGGGCYVSPTLFTGANNQMRIAQEEIFGPVLTAIPFKDEADALALANDVQYGLTGYLWTSDVTRAFRFTEALEAGMIWVNSENVRHLPTPFGGVKNSGIGRDGGDWSFDFYMETKNVAFATMAHTIQKLGG